MKFLSLIFALILLSCTVLKAQQNSISAKTVQATQQLVLAGNGADSLSKDANLTTNSDRKIPTQKAVKGYVDGQVTGTASIFVWYTAGGVRLIRGAHDTLYTAILYSTGGLGVAKSADSSTVTITQGVGGRSGTTTLVSGVKVLSITGITSASLAFVNLASNSGTANTIKYRASCTTNTLTITALDNAAGTNTADNSTLVFNVIN